ncbi:uncharacterized protein UTRI_10316 [Ustilago trichophora]|uniref:Uncharacterized protein n=1 Tax=Ustilago trichophora TaxID=86804 RepID=A0A5C3EMR0_9BASI|nr:uncharacterized protein UTRI_10316 [Ustilago trichophora]
MRFSSFSKFSLSFLFLLSRVSALTLTLNCDVNSGIPNICDGICYYANCRGGKADLSQGLNYDPDPSPRTQRRTAIGFGIANGGYPSVSRGETTCVPTVEQQRQGGQISSQLKGNPSGANYGLAVANFQGSPNCINAQLCQPQGTTRIVTQRQSRRGLEPIFDSTSGRLPGNEQSPVYETASGIKVLQLFGKPLEEHDLQVFIPDDDHPEGGVLTPVYRLNTTSVRRELEHTENTV